MTRLLPATTSDRSPDSSSTNVTDPDTTTSSAHTDVWCAARSPGGTECCVNVGVARDGVAPSGSLASATRPPYAMTGVHEIRSVLFVNYATRMKH